MSTRPCPSCGTEGPEQARFCGHCGFTINSGAPAAPEARGTQAMSMPEIPGRVARTLDEATQDPPPVAAAPPPAPVPLPTKTLYDPRPYGSQDPSPTSQPFSQVHTPLVPPQLNPALASPAAQRPPEPLAVHNMKTMADPEMAERARQVRDQILASQELKEKERETEKSVGQSEAGSSVTDQKQIKTPVAELSPLAVPVAKTLLLGGEHGPPNPLAAKAPTPVPSPLSESVFAPGGIQPVTAAQIAQANAALAAPPPAPPDTAPVIPDAGPLTTGATTSPHGTPLATAGAPPPPIAAPAEDKRTMLGMPAVDLPPPAAAGPTPVHPAGGLKTMLGVAIPGIAPTHEPPPGSQALPLPSQKGTMLGIAVPGIAPTHEPRAPLRGATMPLNAQMPQFPPGDPGARHFPSSSHQPVASPMAPPPPPIVPAPPPLYEEPLPEAPQLAPKRGVPAIAVVGIIIGLLAIAGTAAAFFILRSGATIAAQPLLDENGKESLKMKCESCPDGTIVTLGASSATVQSSAALLPLPAPLSIGENDLSVKIDRPGSGRDEDVKIHVPVAYRVRADLTTLTAKPPAITVRVEATQGSEITIDGKPVTIDDTGRGSYAIDVSADVEGASDEQKTIDKKIPFSIKPKGRPLEQGQLTARAAVIPLHIDAPGRDFRTDKPTAAISGQTKVGATVTIDGQPAPVDAQGRFGVRVALDAMGTKELVIIASSPPLAPRTFRAKVTRSASLDAALKEIEPEKSSTYDVFSVDTAAKIGSFVQVDGEVVEARVAQGHSVLLVEDRKSCAKGASCLVRIVHGEELKTVRGDPVRAFGLLLGTVTASGKTVPDIEGRLVIVRGGK